MAEGGAGASSEPRQEETQVSPPSKGRPRCSVEKGKLEYLRSLNFTWGEAAALLGTSTKTLQRRAKDWNIPRYSTISDGQLDGAVNDILRHFPSSGEVMIRGHLQSQKVRVQRRRVRESIVRVSGRQSRPPPINRRIYSVPGPNALWHIDGNHKLIRWRLVVHGGIDGHSRLITFLHCSSNNLSETVLSCFLEAIQEYGIPSRVRTDHGGENVRVWEFMEEQRGAGRNSYIAGQSVHNSRIERLWRDVYRSVSSSYAALFYDLEHAGALDPTNDADLFALHYIFLPRINSSLAAFTSAWNNHPLSTENNLTPLQIYTAYSQGSQLFDEVIDPTLYGYDPDEPHSTDEEQSVIVPPTNIPLSQSSVDQLNVAINPMQDCNDFGKQLYLDTVQQLFTLMSNDGLID